MIDEDSPPDNLIYELQAQLCHVLADPNRLRIIDSLSTGSCTVNELVQRLGLRQTNVSQHLTIMRQQGVVVARKQGNKVFYSLASPKLTQACALVREILADSIRQRELLTRRLND